MRYELFEEVFQYRFARERGQLVNRGDDEKRPGFIKVTAWSVQSLCSRDLCARTESFHARARAVASRPTRNIAHFLTNCSEF